MINSKNFTYDVERVEQYGYSDFQFISSWKINNKSWKVQKEIPVKIIRYEDLLKETYVVFKDVIEFINKTLHIKEKINKDKLKNSVSSTFFDKLKKDEKNNGFFEAVKVASKEASCLDMVREPGLSFNANRRRPSCSVQCKDPQVRLRHRNGIWLCF